MMGMHVRDLPPRTQENLKALWTITERTGGPASLGELAQRTGQKASTTSEAVKRLAERGFVVHERYLGVTLTETGRRLAIAMVRRHRLLETFLVTVLGYTWDEVHDDADLLEHGASDRLVDRIDAYLGHPRRDPHGDPIPDAAGVVEQLPDTTLLSAPVGQPVTVEQIHDGDPELLRYLARHGIRPGVTVTVRQAPVAGLLQLETGEDGDGVVAVAETAAGAITVRL